MKKILIALSIASISYLSAAALFTDKPLYTTTDTIKINFSEMDNHHKDWIGIYPKGSSTAWKNVVKWAWTENRSEGTVTFKNLPAGEYEVKGFYNNSYDAEATKAFKVKKVDNTGPEVEMYKGIHGYDGFISNGFSLSYKKGLSNNGKDWVAVYKKGDTTEWKNVIYWKWVKDLNRVAPDEEAPLVVAWSEKDLEAGEYEFRFFKNNSYTVNASLSFKIFDKKLFPIKHTFKEDEDVRIKFKNINGATSDKMTIYRLTDVNGEGNALWSKFNKGGVKNGEANFEKLAYGYYKARLYYNNSFKVEDEVLFRVKKN